MNWATSVSISFSFPSFEFAILSNEQGADEAHHNAERANSIWPLTILLLTNALAVQSDYYALCTSVVSQAQINEMWLILGKI